MAVATGCPQNNPRNARQPSRRSCRNPYPADPIETTVPPEKSLKTKLIDENHIDDQL